MPPSTCALLPSLTNHRGTPVSPHTKLAQSVAGGTSVPSATTLVWLNHYVSQREDSRVVALPLPPPPAYHSSQMDLHVVIDRGVKIPEGLVVGEDAALDAKRFRRTEGGICLITQDMIDKLDA